MRTRASRGPREIPSCEATIARWPGTGPPPSNSVTFSKAWGRRPIGPSIPPCFQQRQPRQSGVSAGVLVIHCPQPLSCRSRAGASAGVIHRLSTCAGAGRRILADLPSLLRGEGYLWAPSDGVLVRVAFPSIRTYDSSRTRERGESLASPRTLAEADLSAITVALVGASGIAEEVSAAAARPRWQATTEGCRSSHRRISRARHRSRRGGSGYRSIWFRGRGASGGSHASDLISPMDETGIDLGRLTPPRRGPFADQAATTPLNSRRVTGGLRSYLVCTCERCDPPFGATAQDRVRPRGSHARRT
jgi:hypothetical protein